MLRPPQIEAGYPRLLIWEVRGKIFNINRIVAVRMTLVNVTNVVVENPEASFTSTIKLGVTFECLRELNEPIDWKLVYIGSAHD
jgi:hypothetical protein